MGLFGLFKKKADYFDKNITPKCAYCEYGKPAKSEGKILCPRCGMVDENYSCKKFVYSPFMRVPESEKSRAKSDAVKNVVESIAEKSDEEIEPKSEQTSLQNISESEIKDNLNVVEEAHNTNAETPNPIKNESAQKPDEKSISNIQNKPHDNSDKIKQLENMSKVALSGIQITHEPKKIILPDVKDSVVSSIVNTVEKRDCEEYLKTVDVKSVSGIRFENHTTHQIPSDTKSANVSDMNK